jgi:rhamnosyl/mannosyltransferase
MKVLVLGKYYPPYRGGIETLTRSWCEGFARLGAEVECVVANTVPRTVRERVNGVSLHRCAQHGVLLSTSIASGYLTAARAPADLIQLHFPNPLADFALWLRRGRVPLVITYHSDVVRQAGLMRLYRPLLHWLLRRAARIVVATPPQRDHSRVLAPFRQKCEVIPFGIDLSRFAIPRELPPEIRAARKAADGRPILLNIGRLVGYKGQRYLIEALRRVPAIAWVAGTGPLRDELESLAGEVGVSDRVRFWGEVDDNLLPALLHASDVFVLSSITPNEAFGLAQVEAMACGKPVISCQLPSGVPYVNQHQVTGWVVPPADADALATAAEKLCSDPWLRATLGEAGRRRAQTDFSVDLMVQRYWQLFGRLTSEARGA